MSQGCNIWAPADGRLAAISPRTGGDCPPDAVVIDRQIDGVVAPDPDTSLSTSRIDGAFDRLSRG